MRIIFRNSEGFITEFSHTEIPLPRVGDTVISSYVRMQHRHKVISVEFDFGIEKPIVTVLLD